MVSLKERDEAVQLLRAHICVLAAITEARDIPLIPYTQKLIEQALIDMVINDPAVWNAKVKNANKGESNE